MKYKCCDYMNNSNPEALSTCLYIYIVDYQNTLIRGKAVNEIQLIYSSGVVPSHSRTHLI